MKTINFYEDDYYNVTYAPGKAKVVVLAFAGVQKGLNGIKIEEFKKSLFNRCHVFFIVDKKTVGGTMGIFFMFSTQSLMHLKCDSTIVFLLLETRWAGLVH